MDGDKTSQVVRLGPETILSSSGALEKRGERHGVLRSGDLISNKYEVLRLVAAGGMGEVYAVRHTTLGKDMALKIMLAGSVERFRREAKAAARMSSDRIVRVYDVDQTPEGLSYLVMDLLEGVPLSAALEQGRSFSEQRAIAYVVQLCEALEEAHRHGVTHRDVKPSNLMACGESFDRSGPPDDQVPVNLKLLDFGAARFNDEGSVPIPSSEANSRSPAEVNQAVAGNFTVLDGAMVPGTPAYMSPEQYMQPADVTPAVDIWASGVVLFELLTGRPPFVAEDAAALAQAIVLDPPPLDDISCPKLRAIISRCLEKQPEDRYTSAEALRGALINLLDEKRAQLARDIDAPALRATSNPRGAIRGRVRALLLAGGLAAAFIGIWFAFGARTPAPSAPVELGSKPGEMPGEETEGVAAPPAAEPRNDLAEDSARIPPKGSPRAPVRPLPAATVSKKNRPVSLPLF